MVRVDEVKAARVKAGLTQQDIAEAIGCSANTYRSKEKGVTPFDVLEVEKFCAACGITDPIEKSFIFLA